MRDKLFDNPQTADLQTTYHHHVHTKPNHFRQSKNNSHELEDKLVDYIPIPGFGEGEILDLNFNHGRR
jgi:hypothetical protein